MLIYCSIFLHIDNIAGDLKNGTSITHMVNKMEVVNYLKKIYGPKTSEREQKSFKRLEFLNIWKLSNSSNLKACIVCIDWLDSCKEMVSE